MININDLSQESKNTLLTLWNTLRIKESPPSSVKVLIRELAYRLQEKKYGKLDKNTAVSLRRHMTIFSKALKNGTRPLSPKTPPQTILEVGSILRKNWQGEDCLVKVLGKRSFEYRGQVFKSLSATAKAITGQHVSGPLFFGLKK